jgi:hypothetical protein
MAKELGAERVAMIATNGMGTLLAVEGNLVQARELKEKCLQYFTAAGDEWVLTPINGSLGKICFAEGDLAAARRYIKEAITIARGLGNNWSVPYAIEGIADICAQENEAPKAVRLYGAASAHRAALALQFSTTERVSYQTAMENLHRLVPEAEFQEEWTKGSALGFQESVDLALDRQPQMESART